jgi:hypothetical protein
VSLPHQGAAPSDDGAASPQVIDATSSHSPAKHNQLRKCHLLNLQGLHDTGQYGKIKLIQDLLSDSDSLFIALTETHLNENVLSAELNIENYTLFRSDRINRKCGGVALYVKDGLGSCEELKFSNEYCECLIVKIQKMKTIVITVYRPPSCDGVHFENTLEVIQNYLTNNMCGEFKLFFAGDFNFPFIRWLNNDQRAAPGSYLIGSGSTTAVTAQAKKLLELTDDYFLTQIIEKPTRNENILDLVFVNLPEFIKDIVVNKTALSDHNMIEISLDADILRKSPEYKTVRSERVSFRQLNFFSENVNWENIHRCLANVDWKTLIDQTSSVEEAKNNLDDVLLQVCLQNVPQKRKMPKRSRFHSERNTLMKKLATKKKKLTKERNPYWLGKINDAIVLIEQRIKDSHARERKVNEQNAIQKIKNNTKYFFTYAAKFSTSKTKIGPLIDESGQLVNGNKEMSELLSENYKRVFSIPNNTLPNLSAASENSLTNFNIGTSEIAKAIDDIGSNSAPGPDDIPAILLKQCKQELLVPLQMLWQKSLDTSDIPQKMKHAVIFPLAKGGSLTNPANYRPVSLTSHIVKIFERIVKGRIVNFLETNKWLNPKQHGFRSRRSTLTQLLEHYDDIIHAMCDGSNVDVIYLDFAKAFDKVDHIILLTKLHNAGVRGKVFEWIKNFLQNRTQSVTVNGETSDPVEVLSGVPQGTVLGPLLFLVMANDLSRNCEHSSVSCFADDTRVLGTVKGIEDLQNVQTDLNEIIKWAGENNMQFNESKFELLRYGQNSDLKTGSSYYSSPNTPITEKESLRDLGVIMQNNATFDEQIAKVEASGRRLCSWALRTFLSRDERTMLTLWKQLIQPVMDYCSPLWIPHKRKDLERLEAVQRSFTSKITEVKEMNYHDRLNALRLYSIQRRFERFIIINIWKILEGFSVNVNEKIVEKVTERNQTRTGRMCYFKVPKSTGGLKFQTMAFNSFTCRGPKLFNRMPQEIREVKRLPQLSATANILRFKTRLDKYLSCIPDKPLISGYPHCGDNSLLERNAEPGSDWQMWQTHENVDVTARAECVDTDVGQVAATL